MAETSTSCAVTDNWLASFPLTELPLELQLHIGRFTVEHDYYVEFHEHHRRRYKLRGVDYWNRHRLLAFPHTRHAFHQPLVQHFFKANKFHLRNHDGDLFKWLVAYVGPKNLANMQSLGIQFTNENLFRERFISKADFFLDLRFLKVWTELENSAIRNSDAESEEAKRFHIELFERFPRLQSIEIFHSDVLVKRENIETKSK